MEHVVVRWDAQPGGFWLDPRPYLEVLGEVANALPPGARVYAEAPGHYDFSSERCVKDLRFTSLTVDDANQRAVVEFSANPAKHAEGLALVYSGVRSLSIGHEQADGIGWMGTLLLDEVLPIDGGASHEMALTGGTIKIVASEIEARWR